MIGLCMMVYHNTESARAASKPETNHHDEKLMRKLVEMAVEAYLKGETGGGSDMR